VTRQTLRVLRRSGLLAGWLAVAALVVLPAVHGVHAPHFAGLAAAQSDATPAIAASHANADALGCPLCLGAAQARTAAPPAPVLAGHARACTARAPIACVAAPPLLAATSPAAPRAPPV
jgi:hypothetical protein